MKLFQGHRKLQLHTHMTSGTKCNNLETWASATAQKLCIPTPKNRSCTPQVFPEYFTSGCIKFRGDGNRDTTLENDEILPKRRAEEHCVCVFCFCRPRGFLVPAFHIPIPFSVIFCQDFLVALHNSAEQCPPFLSLCSLQMRQNWAFHQMHELD